MVKFACLTVIFQKICLIVHLFFMMSDKKRHNYKEIEDKYEEGDEGNNKYTGNAFLVILQFLIGIALLFSSFCMIHKRARCTSYLLPWLCTLGVMLEIPLKPVLPQNIIVVTMGCSLLQVFILLCA